MADCGNQVGVKNILLRFFDCDTGNTYGPFTHELSGEEQPLYRLCPFQNQPMTGGYVRRQRGNHEIELRVIRNLGIPLAMYQGCGAVDVTIEHFNGKVISGLSGTSTGEERSDGHEVMMVLIFRDVDELLPAVAA